MNSHHTHHHVSPRLFLLELFEIISKTKDQTHQMIAWCLELDSARKCMHRQEEFLIWNPNNYFLQSR